MSENHDTPTSPQGTDRKAEAGCPVMHDSATAQGSESENPAIDSPTPKQGRPQTNQDWWPNQLDLSVLHAHSPKGNPLGTDFGPTYMHTTLALAVLAPAAKDVRDLRIGEQGVVRGVRLVHGDDVGQPAGRMVGAGKIGRDPHAARRVDVVGGMAGIADGDVLRLGGETEAHRHRARQARHRQALAALRALRQGRRDERTEEGERSDQSRHDGPIPARTSRRALYRRIRPTS